MQAGELLLTSFFRFQPDLFRSVACPRTWRAKPTNQLEAHVSSIFLVVYTASGLVGAVSYPLPHIWSEGIAKSRADESEDYRAVSVSRNQISACRYLHRSSQSKNRTDCQSQLHSDGPCSYYASATCRRGAFAQSDSGRSKLSTHRGCPGRSLVRRASSQCDQTNRPREYGGLGGKPLIRSKPPPR